MATGVAKKSGTDAAPIETGNPPSPGSAPFLRPHKIKVSTSESIAVLPISVTSRNDVLHHRLSEFGRSYEKNNRMRNNRSPIAASHIATMYKTMDEMSLIEIAHKQADNYPPIEPLNATAL